MKLKELVPGVLVLTALTGCDPGNDPLSSVTSVDEVTIEQDDVPGPGNVVVFVKSDFTATEDIVGFGWPPGSQATLEVDYGDNASIDYMRTSTVGSSGVESGVVRFQDYDGQPVPFAATTEGDKVTISGDVGSSTHFVQYLAFGWADFTSDLVCGYARDGTIVSVRVFEGFPAGSDGEGTADATETWCADVGSHDLQPGDWGWAYAVYGAGHTQLHWYTSPMSVDIKPGADPNTINCNALAQVVSVAILTTPAFDATTVDHTTVTFEGAMETHVDAKTGQPRRHEEDVDGDGDMDLVFHFRLGDTYLTCTATHGTLTGQTFEGMAIEGTDALQMIG